MIMLHIKVVVGLKTEVQKEPSADFPCSEVMTTGQKKYSNIAFFVIAGGGVLF